MAEGENLEKICSAAAAQVPSPMGEDLTVKHLRSETFGPFIPRNLPRVPCQSGEKWQERRGR